MGTIAPSNTIPGSFGIRRFAGVPSAGTSEVQTLTIGGTPTGGTMRFSLTGSGTPSIAWNATNATLLANLNAGFDAAVGAGNIVATNGSLTAGIGTVLLTGSAGLAKLALPNIVVVENALTGTSPTLAIAETTPGVTATHRGAPTGAVLTNTTSGLLYENTGTPTAPVWTQQT